MYKIIITSWYMWFEWTATN